MVICITIDGDVARASIFGNERGGAGRLGVVCGAGGGAGGRRGENEGHGETHTSSHINSTNP